MPQYKYLIIGGGMAADAAARQIMKQDGDASCAIITNEEDKPYLRPPLSKDLWTKGDDPSSADLNTEDKGAKVITSRVVKLIKPSEKTVTDDHEEVYEYEKLLLATGGTPRKLPFETEKIVHYRTLADYRKLRQMSDAGSDFVVVGGSFIGSEIAAALNMQGKNVTMIFPEEGICSMSLGPDMGAFITDYYRNKGVEVLTGHKTESITEEDGRVKVVTDKGEVCMCDGVVAGIGIDANDRLAFDAGIPIDKGILVDEYLRTNNPDIYAAGDCAKAMYHDLGTRLRVEHEINATTMGQIAGVNMTGGAQKYEMQPIFYSDMFDLGYEAVGRPEPDMDIYEDWKEKYDTGVIYYMRDGRVKGVVLWNVWNKTDEAGEIIAQQGPITASDLKGRITAE